MMYTIIKTRQKEDEKSTTIEFVTQQYETGTYLIINKDPSQQTVLETKEKDFHIDVRRTAIEENDMIIAGTILTGKMKDIDKLNNFENDTEEN